MRSIRVRLALIFSAITLGAIAGVYVYVAPQLESSLRDQRLEELTRDANRYSRNLTGASPEGAVRQAADRSGARVTLFGVSRGTQGVQTYAIADSTAVRGQEH